MNRNPLMLGLVIVCVSATSLVFSETPDAALERVLERFDEVQNGIETLSAEFTETTESSLLKDVIVAKGRVYLTKPDSVRWEYSTPEEMRFVIASDKYTGYFPERKQAEKRDIHRWREHLFRFLGLGQPSSELASFYDIRLDDTDGSPGTIGLVLDPKKKRVRKRMQPVRFWINESTYLPARIEYRTKDGDTRVIEFEAMRVNPVIEPGLYIVELPPDVKVTKGFSALSGFSAQN